MYGVREDGRGGSRPVMGAASGTDHSALESWSEAVSRTVNLYGIFTRRRRDGLRVRCGLVEFLVDLALGVADLGSCFVEVLGIGGRRVPSEAGQTYPVDMVVGVPACVV
jgi:hypothetical protein